jgi:biopolymer transport protein ExbD
MKKISIAILLMTIFNSCNSKINHIEIDEVVTIDIFEKYEDNFMFTEDICQTNWEEIFSKKIDAFDKNDLKDLTFFVNTLPKEKKIIIQFRYPKFDKPKDLQKMKEVFIGEVNKAKKLYLENKTEILIASRLVEKDIQLVDNGKYEELYNNFHPKVKKMFKYVDFLKSIQEIKNLNIKKANRKYFGKKPIIFNENPLKKINIIEFYYLQTDRNKVSESYNYEIIDGKVYLVGYRGFK